MFTPPAIKRTLDITAALAGLIVGAPVIVLLAAMIRLESPGPAIFSQVRVGRNRRAFTCYKLRSMRTDTANLPTHMVNASAVTRLGRFLRASKLDEVPQLWNVLKGEMSLVGPRPCLPAQTELIEARERAGALAIRPGITGLAQIQGVDMSEPQRLAAIDGAYAADWTVRGDLGIIVKTIIGRGRSVDRVAGTPDA